MKKLLVLLIIFCFISISCNNNLKTQNDINEISLDTLYKQAKDLIGIGPIFIGMHIKNIEQLNKSTDAYLPHCPFKVPYDIKYENKKLHPNLKEYESISYLIGDIEISDIKLYFYRDTLYKIYFKSNENPIDIDIIQALTIKYGVGRKSITISKNIYGLETEEISQIWENQNIILQYIEISPKMPHFINYKARDKWINKNKSSWTYSEWFVIETKSKRILDSVINCETQQRITEEENKKEKEREMIKII